INNGAGVFSDQTATRLPTFTMSSARAQFGDVDNDGDLDLVFCNNGTTRFGSGQPRLYLNNGAGVFADATANLPAGNVAEQMDILFLDVDNDLDLDLFLGTRASTPNQSRLWKNDGTGRFTLQPGIPNDGAAYSYDAGDIDGDGDLDLIGINAGLSNGELLLRNNGDGTAWTNVSSGITPNYSIDDNDSRFFDLDMDGDLDLVVGSLGARDRIYLNNGTGAFAESTTLMAAVSDATLDVKVADFDNDGRFDIITAQGESGAFQNKIYMNLTGPVDNRGPRVQVLEQVTPNLKPVPHVVRATILDDMTSDRGFHDRGVRLCWRTNNGTEQSVPMVWNGNNQWRGVMPFQGAAAQVAYWVTARDWANNLGLSQTRLFTEPGP
ncbi:MAG: FG-GAP repeat domain-containing protein, partial [Phycisphaerales bacterium]